jgi:predicted nucleic acid-binding protein
MAFLFDTNVLIDYLRGHPEAITAVESRIAEAAISTMTLAEIYQGVRDSERTAVSKTLSCFTVIPITEDIAEKGGLHRRDHRHQGAGLADCLIAATAEIHGLTLLTRNVKHYPMLGDVEAPYTKP